MAKTRAIVLAAISAFLAVLLLIVPAPALADEAAPLGVDIVNSGTCGTCTWAIDANGLLTISPTDGVSGTLERSNNPYWPWLSYASSVTSVVVEKGVSAPQNLANLFDRCSNLVTADLTGLDVSSVTNATFLFYGCQRLTSLDTTGWDTSSFEQAYSVFYKCFSLTSPDLSGWDLSSAVSLTNIIYCCE